MEPTTRKIAYLAPEIPALSATFVYNEILAVERLGFEVLPLSVHVPAAAAQEPAPQALAAKTHYLYRASTAGLAAGCLKALFRRPAAFLGTLAMALGDALAVGPFSHTGRGLLFRFMAGVRVAEILVREGCRHLHVHFAHVPTDIAMYASRLSGVPFSFTAHANDLFERGWLLAAKVRRARFAATISEYNRRFLQSQGADPQKVHIVRCGVAASAFAPRATAPPGSPPTIGSLGRMVAKKGFDTLIRAAAQLKARGLRFRLEIAGSGPQQDELQQLAAALDLQPEVVFTGALPHDRVPDWLRRLDLFVLACQPDANGDMDGIPVVLMEAMLSGVPVVSTRLSGIPELVEDGRTGLLADPQDPDGLARAMAAQLEDGEGRSARVARAVEKVRAEFDQAVNAERLARRFA